MPTVVILMVVAPLGQWLVTLPLWHVDAVTGGRVHTIASEPCSVNGSNTFSVCRSIGPPLRVRHGAGIEVDLKRRRDDRQRTVGQRVVANIGFQDKAIRIAEVHGSG